MWRNIHPYWGYILTNAAAEMRVRYAGTALGILWNVIHPLTMVLVLSILLTSLMPARSGASGADDGIEMTLYLATGLLPWVAFTDCIVRGSTALTDNALLLRKLPIPEEVFIAKAAVGSGFYLLIVLLMLFVLCAISGRIYVLSWIGMLGVGVLLLTLGFGLSLVLSPLNVIVRDVGQVVPAIMQIGMWLLPLLYPISLMPDILKMLMPWLPYYPFLVACRELLIEGVAPSALLWFWMAAWAGAMILIGAIVLGRMRAGLRDALQ